MYECNKDYTWYHYFSYGPQNFWQYLNDVLVNLYPREVLCGDASTHRGASPTLTRGMPLQKKNFLNCNIPKN